MKIAIITFLAVILMGLASCKGDYTCTCTIITLNYSQGTRDTTFTNVTNKSARLDCGVYQAELADTAVFTTTIGCNIN